MKLSASVICALVAVQAAVLLASVSSVEAGELKVGYYGKKCRGVENVIKWHVIRAIKANRRIGAALVRLIFHDCFVRVSIHAHFARPYAQFSATR
jgi:peroxidase